MQDWVSLGNLAVRTVLNRDGREGWGDRRGFGRGSDTD